MVGELDNFARWKQPDYSDQANHAERYVRRNPGERNRSRVERDGDDRLQHAAGGRLAGVVTDERGKNDPRRAREDAGNTVERDGEG